MAGTVAPNMVTDGLVLYLDAANSKSYISGSTTWVDIASRNNGTLVNGPTYSSANGGSIVFDGINDYVETTNNINISGTQPRTMESWVYITQNAGKNIMGMGGNLNGTLFDTITWFTSGYLRVIGHYYGVGFDTASTLPARNTLNINQWNQVVHTYDGTTVSIYTNGVYSNGGNFVLNTLNTNVRVGAGNYGPFNYLNGRCSNYKIYNRALSATEILQNYNATKTRFGL
jgi:hypothetical protein